MKKILFIILVYGLILYAQTPTEKVSTILQQKMNTVSVNEKILVWIFFNDKGTNLNYFYADPKSVVSEKSLSRREKVLDRSNLIGFSDLPVNQNYIEQLTQDGFVVKQKSKWFNAVSGYASINQINQISQLSSVKSLDVVGTQTVRKDDIEFERTEPNNDNPLQPEGLHTYNYGSSFTQVNQINVPAVHDSGYTGAGIIICVMDAGFSNLTHEAFSSMDILAKYDFVNGSPVLGGHSHGTATLSLIGGFKPGELIGPAFGATFLLARTEQDPGETPQEEDNWIAAMEWADSIGADVTSTSLGYLEFDPPFTSYTWEDMDGNTARITIAADYAVSLGITVVNSAGNNGENSNHNTLGAPADGDSVITIGAVTSLGERSNFSSVGPTADGRIKPDVMAMGSNNYYASTFGNLYNNGSGTSFSCPLSAGVAALILCANPNLTPMQVRDAMRNTASLSSNPNNEYGWGILDALSAIQQNPLPVELTSFNALFVDGKVNIEWITSTETNNLGFEIQREDQNHSYTTIAFIEGKGTTTSNSYYSFVDKNFSYGKSYYRLKQIDLDGTFEYSNEVLVDIATANEFSLSQNYPNPFNPATTVNYTVPQKANVNIKLYDILGNEIRTLINEEVESGVHSLNIDMNGYSSGMYLLKIIAGDFTKSIKVTLLK